MGKPYVRHQRKENTPAHFTCTKCELDLPDKQAFKKHWRESEDHDQRKLK